MGNAQAYSHMIWGVLMSSLTATTLNIPPMQHLPHHGFELLANTNSHDAINSILVKGYARSPVTICIIHVRLNRYKNILSRIYPFALESTR